MPRRNRRLLQFAREMRRDPTPAEEILWRELRGNALGMKFRRQEPIGPYIADFVCRSRKVVVETDGDAHISPERDRRRDAYMAARGYRIIRFNDEDVLLAPDDSVDHIWQVLSGEEPADTEPH